MKLLLTSGGITNDSIDFALQSLTGKKPSKTNVAFIPTAAMPDEGHKEWSGKCLSEIQARGYRIKLVDLCLLSITQIQDTLEACDVIFVGGGNTFYLSYWMQQTGLFETLPALLKTKVYAGISAGSAIMGQSLGLTSQAVRNTAAFDCGDVDQLGPEGMTSAKTLGLVNFVFRPHLNRRCFFEEDLAALETRAQKLQHTVYALDDASALAVVGDEITVISEGSWRLLPVSEIKWKRRDPLKLGSRAQV